MSLRQVSHTHIFDVNCVEMRYSGEEPQKVIIFDWDDTICPSSFYDRQQMENMDELPESVRFIIIIPMFCYTVLLTLCIGARH
jgi:hypothetical protein